MGRPRRSCAGLAIPTRGPWWRRCRCPMPTRGARRCRSRATCRTPACRSAVAPSATAARMPSSAAPARRPPCAPSPAATAWPATSICHRISGQEPAMPDISLKNEPSACDPVTLEIVRGAIRATQAEMEALIERTSISAFIREKKDFYTALFDADGVMAVGSNIPVFGDMTSPVFARFAPDTMQPGDLYWYNDCYGSRGAISHSNDQVLLAPVFHEGRRCAFVMSWAHFADVGGLRAGSISPDTTDIFQEGVIIPPTKLIDAGLTNEAALEIFHRNSRFPAQSRGDMRALMASVEVGVRRVAEIVARFGADVVEDALRQLLARTRRTVRERLAETFAPGVHSFTDAIDSDGHGSGPFRIRFSLAREVGADGEDRFVLDASETDDQAAGPVNFLMNPGVPGMALGLFYLGGDPRQVCNAGG